MDSTKLLAVTGYASSIAGIIGAFLIASGLPLYGYPFLLLGSLAGVIASKGNKGLKIQFVVFSAINFYAILRLVL